MPKRVPAAYWRRHVDRHDFDHVTAQRDQARHEVESLRQQLEGAVDVLLPKLCAVVEDTHDQAIMLGDAESQVEAILRSYFGER